MVYMKITTISGILGTLILCMMTVLFIHPTELVERTVSDIAITLFVIEGVVLIIYSIFGDN